MQPRWVPLLLYLLGSAQPNDLSREQRTEQKLRAANAAFSALDAGLKKLAHAPPPSAESGGGVVDDSTIAAYLGNVASEKYAAAAARKQDAVQPPRFIHFH